MKAKTMKIPAITGIFLLGLLLQSCQTAPSVPLRSREESIPVDAVKLDPADDPWPPLAAEGWSTPQPLPGPINTAGAEDSPFLSEDGEWFFFVFIPDLSVPPQEQLFDGATGIWAAHRDGDSWGEPARVLLSRSGVPSLDGCPTLFENELYFCSARAGNQRNIDIYLADWQAGEAENWRTAGQEFNADYEVGELHISPDGQWMVFASQRAGGLGGYDLWISNWIGTGWGEPANLGPSVNSAGDENRPYLSPDGQSLWFDGISRKGLPGPAIFRAERLADGRWGEAQEVISQFAGEPTLSVDGQSIYFVHHYFNADLSAPLESDIYVSYRVSAE